MNLQEFDLGPVKEDLRLTGRTPARHSLVVRAVRRVLWPFIRPYHFVALEWTRDRLVETHRRMDAIPAQVTDSVLGSLPPSIDHRPELDAIKDAIGALEGRMSTRADLDAVREWVGALEGRMSTRAELDAAKDWIGALEGRMSTHAELDAVRQSIGALEGRLHKRIETLVASETVSAGLAQAALRAEVIAVSRVLEQWRNRVEAAETGLAGLQAWLAGFGDHTNDLAGRIDGFGEALRVAQDRMDGTIQGHRNSMALRVRQIEQRLAGVGGAHPDAGETPFTGLGAGSFTLGNAVFHESEFGPVIMRPVDMVTRNFVRQGRWDDHVLTAMRAVAERTDSPGARSTGRVAVDAGAHCGVISCMMASLFETVHAFEANRETFVFLCANAALRPPGRIRPYNLALWSSATTVSLARPEEQDIRIRGDIPLEAAFRAVENPGSLCFAPEGSGVNTIEARALDDFALQDVGFIKIDCQGADGHVIMGALDTIRRCRPVVVFEWETLLAADRGISLDQVIGVLAAIGYEVRPLYAHNEKQIDYIAMPLDGETAD